MFCSRRPVLVGNAGPTAQGRWDPQHTPRDCVSAEGPARQRRGGR